MLSSGSGDEPSPEQQNLELEMARLIQIQLEEEWPQAMECLCLLHYAQYDGCRSSIWFEVCLCSAMYDFICTAA